MKKWIYIIFTVLFACYYLLPQVQYFVNIQTVGFFSFSYFLLFCSTRQHSKNSWNVIAMMMPYVLLMFLIGRPFDLKMGLVHSFLLLWIYIFPFILCENVLSINSLKCNKLVVSFTLVIFLVVGYQTISMMKIDPTIARAMTSSLTDEDYKTEMKLYGVGGFGFCYSAGLLLVSIINLMLRYQLSKIWKLISISLALFLFFVIINAMFTTLIIITILALLVFFFYYAKDRGYIVFFVLASIILLILVPLLFSFAISFYGDTPVGIHLGELYTNIFKGGEVSSERTFLRGQCISQILSSPIWGSNVSGSLYYLYSNAHSSLMSVAIATGCIGVFFYLKTIYMSFRTNLRISNSQSFKTDYFPLIVYYILLTMNNPAETPELGWIVFLFIPMVFNSFELKDEYK